VLVLKEYHYVAAKKHGISVSAVSRIVKEFKSDKDVFGPIMKARMVKAQRK
jgi:hypothetical protein